MLSTSGISPSPSLPLHLSPSIPTASSPSGSKYNPPRPSSDTMVDLEKNDRTLTREEIVPHYPDYAIEPASSSHHHTSSLQNGFVSRLRRLRHNHREFLAELVGTTVLVFLINGVSAEQILNISEKSWLTVAFGNGLAVLFAISICGHISGAHTNPAVTLTLWLFGTFPGHKVLIYWSAQLLGAFLGSALLYSITTPAINQFDGGVRQILGDKSTAGIFATYPPSYVGTGTAIASEVVGTSLLCLLVHTTAHPSNQPFQSIQGCIVATGVISMLTSVGYTSGFSLNPARDVGPRLFTAVAGWGPGVFYVLNYYALVPMFAPFLGAIVGGTVYLAFIDHDHIPNC